MRGGVVAAALAAAVALVPASQASFPGRNGKIAVSVEGCVVSGNQSARYIQTFGPGGRKLKPLTGCDGDRWGPDWAPGGRRLTVGEFKPHEDYHFTTMRADGSHRRSIALMPELGFGPSFLPGGGEFLFVNDVVGDPRFYVARARDGHVRELFTDLCRDERCPMYDPRVSPDGRRVAVTLSTGFKGSLWLARLRRHSGTTIRRIARGGSDADWSPDGRHLVYTSFYSLIDAEATGEARGANLYVADADGRHRRRILRTHDVAATEPTWSPDGRWIAYVQLDFRNQPKVASLWKVRVSRGKRPHTIGKPRKLASLPKIVHSEDDEFRPPGIAWQPRPRHGR